jgi:hypothetical protein
MNARASTLAERKPITRPAMPAPRCCSLQRERRPQRPLVEALLILCFSGHAHQLQPLLSEFNAAGYNWASIPDGRHFPPPWSVEKLDSCFVVKDLNGWALAYMPFEKEHHR